MKRHAPTIDDLTTLATERSNPRTRTLDAMSTRAMLTAINREDATVPGAVAKAIPQIAQAVERIVPLLKNGGRLFYIGAGTSGRLGCVDASEMPPTYGVSSKLVQGIIAGGFGALRRSIEGAEDDAVKGAAEMQTRAIGPRDAVIGLSASGRAKYVQAALTEASKRGAFTACITCNRNSALIPLADVPIVADTGAEVVAGSTRMKAGTAQKLVLNMISTSVMVQLGRVKGNRMMDLKIKCDKLRERAARIVADEAGVDMNTALKALTDHAGSIRKSVAALQSGGLKKARV
ncbi:MAG: N-acetylmuramic acid 6-phosphate etherase [Planctomycetota bacterium]